MTKCHSTAGWALESIVIMKCLTEREVQCFADFIKSATLVENVSFTFLLSGNQRSANIGA